MGVNAPIVKTSEFRVLLLQPKGVITLALVEAAPCIELHNFLDTPCITLKSGKSAIDWTNFNLPDSSEKEFGKVRMMLGEAGVGWMR